MKRIISLVLVLVILLISALALVSCSDEEVSGNDSTSQAELTKGENGNWWVGGKDTGISATVSVVNKEAVIVSSGGVDYCAVTLTFSDGTKEKIMVEMPKDEEFITSITISNGFGGANGIICLMTDNDSGKFETIEILDELYIEYGLVGGLGTVVKNLYTDKTYTTRKTAEIEKWQEFLDTGRWKIINHSMTHTTYMDTVGGERVINEERLYDELVRSAELLRELFPDERVLTYANTGTQSAIGESTDPTNIRECERELIAEYYIGGRFKGTGSALYSDLQWNNLPYSLLSRANLSYILNHIDKTANEGRFYMVYNHYVIEDELFDTVNESSWTNYSTAKALCERVAKYVNDGSVWNAHFEDAIMYMRERETASVMASYEDGAIRIILTDEMDNAVYNHELTLRVTVPEDWEAAKITQGGSTSYAEVKYEDGEGYILANVLPDGGVATVEPISADGIPESKPDDIKPTPDVSDPSDGKPEQDAQTPSVYTFDDLSAILGTSMKFDNKGKETTTIAAVKDNGGNALEFKKLEAGENPNIVFTGTKTDGASCVAFESDVKFALTGGEMYLTLRANSDSTPIYQAYLKVVDGKLTFTDYNDDRSLTNKYVDTGVGAGEWFKLRIEYTEGSRDSLSFKVYINGNSILDSSVYYSSSGSVLGAEAVGHVRLNYGSTAIGACYLDNVSLSQTAGE